MWVRIRLGKSLENFVIRVGKEHAALLSKTMMGSIETGLRTFTYPIRYENYHLNNKWDTF